MTNKAKIAVAFALAVEWGLAFAFAKRFAIALANANADLDADALTRIEELYERIRYLEGDHGRIWSPMLDGYEVRSDVIDYDGHLTGRVE